MASVLQHPTATAAADPWLNARTLFGWAATDPQPIVDLWILEIGGVEYITDRGVLVRREVVEGVTEDWSRLVHRGIEYAPVDKLYTALLEKLSTKPTKARFDPRRIGALYACGAGVLPIAGNQVLDVHAVLLGGVRIGLAVPLRARFAESALGCVPGAPPWPGDVDAEGVEW